jgi:hypothetical protein
MALGWLDCLNNNFLGSSWLSLDGGRVFCCAIIEFKVNRVCGIKVGAICAGLMRTRWVGCPLVGAAAGAAAIHRCQRCAPGEKLPGVMLPRASCRGLGRLNPQIEISLAVLRPDGWFLPRSATWAAGPCACWSRELLQTSALDRRCPASGLAASSPAAAGPRCGGDSRPIWMLQTNQRPRRRAVRSWVGCG